MLGEIWFHVKLFAKVPRLSFSVYTNYTQISAETCDAANRRVKVTVKSVLGATHVHRGSLIHHNTTEVSDGKFNGGACTHVPRTSLKSNIFLMSSTCFFHVSPLPASPFSRAMALLHRPKSDRQWGSGRWEDAGRRERRGNENWKVPVLCEEMVLARVPEVFRRVLVLCAPLRQDHVSPLLQVTVSLAAASLLLLLSPSSPYSPPAVWTAAVSVTRAQQDILAGLSK